MSRRGYLKEREDGTVEFIEMEVKKCPICTLAKRLETRLAHVRERVMDIEDQMENGQIRFLPFMALSAQKSVLDEESEWLKRLLEEIANG